MLTIEFVFEGATKTYELHGDLKRNPVKNGVRLLRGEGLDPQEVRDCFLHGIGTNQNVIRRESVLRFLINGLDGEALGTESFAEPMKIAGLNC